MVAYSFAPYFHDQVSGFRKLQTIRAPRKRHARPGETLQLYAGMRTRQCRKLVDPDPTCTAVVPIAINVGVVSSFIEGIEIEGVQLSDHDIEAFAGADGFAVANVGDWHFKRTGQAGGSARWNMGYFWIERHGMGVFDGVLIRWAP